MNWDLGLNELVGEGVKFHQASSFGFAVVERPVLEWCVILPIQRVYWSQAQVTLNDNASKIVLIGLLNHPLVTGDGPKGFYIALVSASILLPFILLAPVTGWCSDRFSKRQVLWYSLIAQVVVVLGFFIAFLMESMTVALLFVAGLAVQSAFFGPPKMGIVKELVEGHHVPKAISWLELLGVGAILLGTLLGAGLFDLFQSTLDIGPWGGGVYTALTLLLLSVWALWLFYPVPSQPGQKDLKFSMRLFVDHFRQVVYLWERRPLLYAGLGNAFFFGVGGILYLTFVQYGEELHGGEAGSSTHAAVLFAVLGISLGLGSYLVSFAHKERIRLSMVPWGILVMGIGLLLCSIGLFQREVLIYIGLVIAGLGAGTLNVTVNAFLIDESPADYRGRVISAANLLTNVSGLLGIGIYWWMREVLYYVPGEQMLVLTLVTFTASGITGGVMIRHFARKRLRNG